MLFAPLADDVYRYAGPLGRAAGLLVGLYSYWMGRGRKGEEAAADRPVGATEPARCPHCRATLPEARDAFCPSCREPLDE